MMRYPALQSERQSVLKLYFEDLEIVMASEGIEQDYIPLLQRLGLSYQDLSDPSGKLSFDHYLSALRIIEEGGRIPVLGVRLGLLKSCSTFGTFGIIFLTQETMLRANSFAHDVFELCFGHYLRLEHRLDNEWMAIRYSASPPSQALNVSLMEQALTTGFRVLSEALPRVNWSNCRAQFAFSPPPYADQYSNLLPFPCSFGHPINTLIVPRKWGELRSPFADEGISQFCEERLRARLQEEFKHSYLARQMRRISPPRLPAKCPSSQTSRTP